MRYRRFLTTAAAAALMLSACACDTTPIVSRSNKQITLDFSWWGNDSRNRYTLEAIDTFCELHPEIRVNCSYSEWTGFETRNKVQMISDTEADVMQINFGWLTTYSQDGLGYYDINGLTDTFQIGNFSEQMLDYGMKSDHLNAVPIAMNAETVYINKTIYDQYGLDIPETWDDLFNAAKVMRKDGIYPMSAAAKPMWFCLIAYTEQAQGKSFLREDGSLNFDSRDFAVMIECYQRLTSEGVMPQVERYERINLDNKVYAGTVAWVSDAAGYFDNVIENGSEIVCADYTTMAGKPAGTGWYAKPSAMYAVSKNTEHPREAAMLLDFLLNSSEMAALQGIEKGIPLSSAAQQTIEEKGMLTGIQYDASQKMEDIALGQLPAVLEDNSLIVAFFATANGVIYETTSLNEAASALYDQIRKTYF